MEADGSIVEDKFNDLDTNANISKRLFTLLMSRNRYQVRFLSARGIFSQKEKLTVISCYELFALLFFSKFTKSEQ